MSFWRRQHPTERQIDQISAVLGFEYDFEDSTYGILKRNLRDRDLPDPSFEFILGPRVGYARFRLKWADDGPRVAYYPVIGAGNPEIEEKCAEITQDLRKIMEGGRIS